MSRKRYRRPANPGYISPAVAAAAPQVNPMLEKLTNFLGDLMSRVSRALDQAEALPVEEASWDYGTAARKQALVMSLIRIGISAARTLIQALRQSGVDTRQVAEVAAKLEERLEQKLGEVVPAQAA